MEHDNRTEPVPVGRLYLWWVLLIMGEKRKLPAKSTADPHQFLVIFLFFSFIVFLYGWTALWLGGLHCCLAVIRWRVRCFTEWNLYVLLMSALGLLQLWCPYSKILNWYLGLLKDGSSTEVRTFSRNAHC